MPIRSLLLALIFLAPLCHAGALYSITPLPAHFNPADINNAGRMAGALYAADGSVHAAIYADGSVADLGLFGMPASYASAINDNGTIAGNFVTAEGVEHAFVYQAGAVHDIGAAVALGMNAGGDIVGQTYTSTGAVAFLYRGSSLIELGYLGNGNVSRATAINDAGHIVGESNLAAGAQAPTHPFLFDGAAWFDLGTLTGVGVTSAVAINNAGHIAGYSDAGRGRTHVFFYEDGAMTDLGSFGGFDVTIGEMNALGQVVGTGNTPDGPDVAFISRDGTLVDLNTLIDPASGWAITSALDINDSGQIIANACRDGVCRAVRLDLAAAVPEPDATLLWLAGVSALAGALRKRRREQMPRA